MEIRLDTGLICLHDSESNLVKVDIDYENSQNKSLRIFSEVTSLPISVWDNNRGFIRSLQMNVRKFGEESSLEAFRRRNVIRSLKLFRYVSS